MKFQVSFQALAITGFAVIGLVGAWGKDHPHQPHSVSSKKTSHRAKTTYISNTLLDPYTDKDASLKTLTSFKTASPTNTVTLTKDKAKPTCAHIPHGATDTPAFREPGTTVIFREQCGITDETVRECPFLCGPGGQGAIKACFSEDVSRFAGDGTEVCIHCLSPCKSNDVKSKLPTAKPSKTTKPSGDCTYVSMGAIDTPAATDSGTGLLFRRDCGFSKDTVAQCPYLCGQGTFNECSDVDFSGEGPDGFPPAFCITCLPACETDTKDAISDTTPRPGPSR